MQLLKLECAQAIRSLSHAPTAWQWDKDLTRQLLWAPSLPLDISLLPVPNWMGKKQSLARKAHVTDWGRPPWQDLSVEYEQYLLHLPHRCTSERSAQTHCRVCSASAGCCRGRSTSCRFRCSSYTLRCSYLVTRRWLVPRVTEQHSYRVWRNYKN